MYNYINAQEEKKEKFIKTLNSLYPVWMKTGIKTKTCIADILNDFIESTAINWKTWSNDDSKLYTKIAKKTMSKCIDWNLYNTKMWSLEDFTKMLSSLRTKDSKTIQMLITEFHR